MSCQMFVFLLDTVRHLGFIMIPLDGIFRSFFMSSIRYMKKKKRNKGQMRRESVLKQQKNLCHCHNVVSVRIMSFLSPFHLSLSLCSFTSFTFTFVLNLSLYLLFLSFFFYFFLLSTSSSLLRSVPALLFCSSSTCCLPLRSFVLT